MKLHSVSTPGSGPRVVLIHGLDSSSRTWKVVGESLNSPTVAMDQRTCGLSDDGDLDHFSQSALVADIHEIVEEEEGKVVVVGHSLGGRVALAYAAQHPDRVAALIIEDMDIQNRPPKTGVFNFENDVVHFDRAHKTKDTIIDFMLKGGYKIESINRWIEQDRIEQLADGSWWSHVNPMFRNLCYQHVLGTDNGKIDCKQIVEQGSSFPCHVLVAGERGTVCSEGSVQEMKAILGGRLTIHRYPAATHSIHSSAREEFLRTVETIVQSV